MAKDIITVTDRSTRRPPFKKLDMNVLLDMACWQAENFEEFEEWNKKQYAILEDPEKSQDDIPPYVGWRRYSVILHCAEIVIIARKHPANGGYQIRDYLVQNH